MNMIVNLLDKEASQKEKYKFQLTCFHTFGIISQRNANRSISNTELITILMSKYMNARVWKFPNC